MKVADAGSIRIELTARPTAVVWHPHIGDDIEDRCVCLFVLLRHSYIVIHQVYRGQ